MTYFIPATHVCFLFAPLDWEVPEGSNFFILVPSTYTEEGFSKSPLGFFFLTALEFGTHTSVLPASLSPNLIYFHLGSDDPYRVILIWVERHSPKAWPIRAPHPAGCDDRFWDVPIIEPSQSKQSSPETDSPSLSHCAWTWRAWRFGVEECSQHTKVRIAKIRANTSPGPEHNTFQPLNTGSQTNHELFMTCCDAFPF